MGSQVSFPTFQCEFILQQEILKLCQGYSGGMVFDDTICYTEQVETHSYQTEDPLEHPINQKKGAMKGAMMQNMWCMDRDQNHSPASVIALFSFCILHIEK